MIAHRFRVPKYLFPSIPLFTLSTLPVSDPLFVTLALSLWSVTPSPLQRHCVTPLHRYTVIPLHRYTVTPPLHHSLLAAAEVVGRELKGEVANVVTAQQHNGVEIIVQDSCQNIFEQNHRFYNLLIWGREATPYNEVVT